jgi:hypothetical protein
MVRPFSSHELLMTPVTSKNFLRGHVHAFQAWSGQPRVILYDNLKSCVLERGGNQILFHPRLIELSAHYHFVPRRPCQVRAGNQKERVERHPLCPRFLLGGRTFTTLAECNRQALPWCMSGDLDGANEDAHAGIGGHQRQLPLTVGRLFKKLRFLVIANNPCGKLTSSVREIGVFLGTLADKADRYRA